MKRILSVLVMLGLVLSLAACAGGKAPAEAIADAEEAMADSKYIFTATTAVSSDSTELNDALAVLNASEGVPIMIDGDNMKLDVSMQGSSVIMTVCDGILYYALSDGTNSAKMKYSVGSDEAQQILPDDFEAEATFDVSDFDTVEVTEEGGRTTVSCSDVDLRRAEDDIEDQIDELDLDTLLGEGTEVSCDDVSMTVVISDGRFESMAVSYSLSVVYGGETVAVEVTAAVEFDYETYFEISAPIDAEDYIDLTEGSESGS